MPATLPTALVNVACAPMLVRLHAQGNAQAIARMNAAIVLVLLASGAVATLLFFSVGEPLITMLFGMEYGPSNRILVVLLAGELAASAFGHPLMALSMLHRERAASRYSMLALLSNAFVCVLLVPRFGGVGAASAFAISQVCWRFMCWRDARRTLGMDTSILALRPLPRPSN